MTTDGRAATPHSPLRRKDRRLDDEAWIDRLLEGAAIGHLAMVGPDGEVTIHSHNFWAHGTAIYHHGAPWGALAEAVSAGPLHACFTVTEAGRILVADAAVDFGTEFASVVAWGVVSRVDGERESAQALDGLMRKYLPHLVPGRDYRPASPEEVRRTYVYRLDVERRIAKHNIRAAGHPSVPYPAFSFIDEERAADRLTNRPKPSS
jgi:hypothetical protein